MKPRVLIPLGAALLIGGGVLFFFWPLLFSGAARVWIVSPQGRGDSCSLFSPCDLLTAQSQARAAKINGDALIYLRGGTYSLTETWKITAEDSGKDGHWTIVRAYPGETPVLSGGVVVNGWEKGSDGVYSAAWDGAPFRQLYADGRRMVRARTPNRANDTDMGPYLRPLAWRVSKREIAVRSEDVAGIPLDGAVEMVIASHWHHYRLRPSGMTLEGDLAWLDFREPERREPAFGHIASLDAGIKPEVDESYYWENDRSFLDAPGEWFLDEAAGRVYFIPPAGMDSKQVEIVVPQVETLVSISGSRGEPVQRLRLEGLTLAYSTWLRPSLKGYVTWQAAWMASSGADGPFPGMVRLSQVEDVELRGCTLRHSGAHGLVTFGPSQRLMIVGNLFEDLSAGAIMLEVGANESGGSLEDRVADNTIRAAGRDYSEAVGIWASFPKKLTIEHNELSNLPYSGISVGWRWDISPTAAGENLIQANHIYQVMQKHDDGGAIYTLGRQPGTVIRENYIHDLVRSPYAGKYPLKGIYLDEGSTEISVIRNYVELPLDDTLNLHKTGEPLFFDDPILGKATPADREQVKKAAGPRNKP